MKLREIMKSDASCVSPGDTIRDAARQMKEENIGFLPVCDDSEKVLGTITDRDITVRVVAEGKSWDTKVQDVMSRDVISARPDDELTKAENLMSNQQKSRLVVTDDKGILEGVISLSDLTKSDLDSGARTMRGVTNRESRAS
jgi:CBS domain-containing protein